MSRPDDGRAEVPSTDPGGRPDAPVPAPPHRPLAPADPAQAGPYRLEALLGEGGMGRVYLGRTPAGSAVAVKIVHRAYAADPSFRRRFELEVAAARRVQGLYTVPVVDADLAADEPWLATAYVPGPSLQHAVAEGGALPTGTVLGLVARVAEALQSIHAAGVIHRDLKPSNIILSAEGPKVIDFGIARAADVTAVTVTGMRTGTPAYMAPEYIRGQTVTEAGDVFALGVVAHFAATGRLAFGGGTDHAVVYRILEQAPDLDGCPEALRAVVTRCLDKDPDRRPTPREVIEQCGRAASPGAAAAYTPTAVSVSPLPAQSPRPAAPAPPAAPGTAGAPDADTRTSPARAGSRPAVPGPPADPVLPHARPLPPPPGTDPAAEAETETEPASSPRLFTLIAGVVVLIVATVLVAVLLSSSPGTHRTVLAYPTVEPEASLAFPARSKGPEGLAFSPDGRTLATGSEEGAVRLWDVATRRPAVTLVQHDGGGNVIGVRRVAFSPDGRTLATSSDYSHVGVWDVAGRRETNSFDEVTANVAFSPDGKLIAAAIAAGVLLWKVNGHGKDPRAFLGHDMHITDVAFSPDGKALASVGDDSDNLTGIYPSTAVLWDMTRLHPEPYGQGDPRLSLSRTDVVSTAAFSPDGKTLATGGPDGKTQLWDVATGHLRATLTDAYVDAVTDLAFSPDGRTLATNSTVGVLLWDVATRKPRTVLADAASSGKGPDDAVEELAFSPDGRLVAGTDAKERAVRLWQVPHGG